MIAGDIYTSAIGGHKAGIFVVENTVDVVYFARGVWGRGVCEAEWRSIEDGLAIALLTWRGLFAALEYDGAQGCLHI